MSDLIYLIKNFGLLAGGEKVVVVGTLFFMVFFFGLFIANLFR